MRKNIRLPGYDYSQGGVYFITICTKNHQSIFWDKAAPVGATCGRLPLSEVGKIVDGEIIHLSAVYPNVWVEKHVVMPNHIHLLICIDDEENGRPQVAPTISRIIKQFKGVTSKRCGESLWQKSFHDHIIRDDNDFLTKWNYIDTNPVRWGQDEYCEG